MFEGHDPYLVALSVAIAILGGYTGFGLTARIRGTPDASHRLLLAGAAFFLAIGIWTMHFVGTLAAPLPPGTVYLVLPTIVSFLICALVVGISLFFVSVGDPPVSRVASSAVLLGVGIASMHYVGMHGLSGDFAMTHRISGEGSGGVAGFAKGGATVRLESEGPDVTMLHYDVDAQIGGKLAQLGSRLIDSTAKKLAGQFFASFGEVVGGRVPAA